jgi:hypothetical protein
MYTIAIAWDSKEVNQYLQLNVDICHVGTSVLSPQEARQQGWWQGQLISIISISLFQVLV